MSESQNETQKTFADLVEEKATDMLGRQDLVPHDVLLLTQAVTLAKTPIPTL